MFDIRQRRKLHQFVAHNNSSVTCMAINHSEKTLATGSSDGTVKIWDLNTNKQEQSFKAHCKKNTGIYIHIYNKNVSVFFLKFLLSTYCVQVHLLLKAHCKKSTCIYYK